jgi:hypothetical protein
MVSRGRLRVLAWHPAALIGLLVAACVIYATATWSRAAGAFFYMDDFVGKTRGVGYKLPYVRTAATCPTQPG